MSDVRGSRDAEDNPREINGTRDGRVSRDAEDRILVK